MKTFEEIINFKPQIVEIKYGSEPNIKDLIKRYYSFHILDQNESKHLTNAWLIQLKEFLEN